MRPRTQSSGVVGTTLTPEPETSASVRASPRYSMGQDTCPPTTTMGARDSSLSVMPGILAPRPARRSLRLASQAAGDRPGGTGPGTPALAQGARPPEHLFAKLCLPRSVALPERLRERLDCPRHARTGEVRDAFGTKREVQGFVETCENAS